MPSRVETATRTQRWANMALRVGNSIRVGAHSTLLYSTRLVVRRRRRRADRRTLRQTQKRLTRGLRGKKRRLCLLFAFIFCAKKCFVVLASVEAARQTSRTTMIYASRPATCAPALITTLVERTTRFT